MESESFFFSPFFFSNESVSFFLLLWLVCVLKYFILIFFLPSLFFVISLSIQSPRLHLYLHHSINSLVPLPWRMSSCSFTALSLIGRRRRQHGDDDGNGNSYIVGGASPAPHVFHSLNEFVFFEAPDDDDDGCDGAGVLGIISGGDGNGDGQRRLIPTSMAQSSDEISPKSSFRMFSSENSRFQKVTNLKCLKRTY